MQNSQWQTRPNMMQRDSNTLQRGIMLVHGANVDCIKQRHSQQIREVVSKDHLNLHTLPFMVTEGSIGVKAFGTY